VTSFSEKRDALSQWRGYCGGLDGFAIGIDKSKLPDTPEAKVKRVLYSDSLAASSATADYMRSWLDQRLSATGAPSTNPGMLDHRLRQLYAFRNPVQAQGLRRGS